jgi:hypothetical protein
MGRSQFLQLYLAQRRKQVESYNGFVSLMSAWPDKWLASVKPLGEVLFQGCMWTKISARPFIHLVVLLLQETSYKPLDDFDSIPLLHLSLDIARGETMGERRRGDGPSLIDDDRRSVFHKFIEPGSILLRKIDSID